MKVFLILLTVSGRCCLISSQSDAAPEFKNTKDGPPDITVTVGGSVTFNCDPFAKPRANIVWFLNGQRIDTDNPPERFTFSNDLRSLTIRDVCRDCDDRESKTDLTVIQCNASNVHGYAFASGYINVFKGGNREDATWMSLKVIIGAGIVGLVLLLIGIFSPFRSDVIRRKNEIKSSTKCERIEVHSTDHPLETVGNSERSMRSGFSMYEEMDYNSIGQVREETTLTEGTTIRSSDIDEGNKYESIDEIRRGAMVRGGPTLDEEAIYDDTGQSIPLEEVVNAGKTNPKNINGIESVPQCEAGQIHLKPKEVSLYSDLRPIAENPYSEGPREVNLYSELDQKETIPHLALNSIEENLYTDLGPKEANLYSKLGSKEVDLDLGKKKGKQTRRFWARKK